MAFDKREMESISLQGFVGLLSKGELEEFLGLDMVERMWSGRVFRVLASVKVFKVFESPSATVFRVFVSNIKS